MKKNNLGIISIVLLVFTILIFFVATILSNKNNKKEEILNNATLIKKNYTNLIDENMNNISIRKELINKLNAFNSKEYASLHEGYIETLNNYNNNVSKIKEAVDTLNEKCEYEFEEGTTNVLCRSYSGVYEEVVNIYITVLTNYNNKITSLNETSEEKYELYTTIYTEYIDVNNDGKYQGKDITINN